MRSCYTVLSYTSIQMKMTIVSRRIKEYPRDWAKLVEGTDELLLELVAEATEDFCGHKPSVDEQVLDFLKTLGIAPETNFRNRHHRHPLNRHHHLRSVY